MYNSSRHTLEVHEMKRNALFAIVVLAAIAAGVIFLVSSGGSLSFICEIEDGPARKRPCKIKFGQSLYVIDGVMGLNILPNAGQTPAAELTADKEGVHLSVSDEKQCSVEKVPTNLLGKTLEIRKKNGRKARLTFQAV